MYIYIIIHMYIYIHYIQWLDTKRTLWPNGSNGSMRRARTSQWPTRDPSGHASSQPSEAETTTVGRWICRENHRKICSKVWKMWFQQWPNMKQSIPHPSFSRIFSHFPMIFPWFSHDFPMFPELFLNDRSISTCSCSARQRLGDSRGSRSWKVSDILWDVQFI